MIETVGLVGVGTMGEPMGESLLRKGFALHVCAHRNRAGVERLVARGATEHGTPRDVASHSELIITMVPDAPQVEEAIFGPVGIARGAQRRGIIVDMSTISPVASRTFHERLAHDGLNMLDAPVSGGPARAKTGQLTIMAGGELDTYERAEPVLRAMGTPTHVGPRGMGETFKLVNQIIIGSVMVADVEGLVFARKAGADITLLRRVLGTATASNYLLDTWLPKAWFEDRHHGGFALDLLRKDLRAALDAGQALGAPMFSSTLSYDLYSQASGRGLGRDDYSAVADVYEQAAGTKVVE
jgi:3-hydroxyisobutyrate dehydrogenase-like beta-hydroxyacid dehydrogenase